MNPAISSILHLQTFLVAPCYPNKNNNILIIKTSTHTLKLMEHNHHKLRIKNNGIQLLISSNEHESVMRFHIGLCCHKMTSSIYKTHLLFVLWLNCCSLYANFKSLMTGFWYVISYCKDWHLLMQITSSVVNPLKFSSQ